MSDQTDNISHLLTAYGLQLEEANIYLLLLSKRWLSALQISRDLHIGRTKVYRLLDKLAEKELIEQKLDNMGLKFGATSPAKIQQLLSYQQYKLESLQKGLPDVLHKLEAIAKSSGGNSKALYYKGLEGLKQVSWNTLKAKKLLRVYEVEHISDFLPTDFSENYRTQLVKRKITTHDLTNKSSFSGFTDVVKLVAKYSQFRHIDPKKLNIQFEALIYNDVYATYTYKDKEVFCVEIHNPQLAAMQKQIFDFIWECAEPMRFTDKRGAAEIEKQKSGLEKNI